MIPREIKDKICLRLAEIEQEKQVRVLYACESGSRAWGFPSVDSDYDVRFLYIHPTEWYLSIEEKRDVIEQTIEDHLDLSGWEIRKALNLFRKSNPPLLEWLCSPVVYQEKYRAAQNMRALLPEFYSPVACLYHYLHMARGNFREYLKGETVWIKKYFYMLRPVLACKWIEQDLGPVPMEFEVLVDRIIEDRELRKEISNLIKRKKEGEELAWGPKIPAISNFLAAEIERLESERFDKRKRKPDLEKLNELFRSALKEVWEIAQ